MRHSKIQLKINDFQTIKTGHLVAILLPTSPSSYCQSSRIIPRHNTIHAILILGLLITSQRDSFLFIPLLFERDPVVFVVRRGEGQVGLA